MELAKEKKLELTRKEFGIEPKDLYLRNNKIYLCGKSLDKWHREMWDWIAENPNAEDDIRTGKGNFVYEHFDDVNVIKLLHRDSYCFGCLYVSIVEDDGWCGEPCGDCPLCEYEQNKGCLNGLFYLYGECLDDPKLRKDMAHKIADLEWEWK